MYNLPSDIIDYILEYLDNQSYHNCLLTATIFHTYRLNNTNYDRYLWRKYKEKFIDKLAKIGDLEGIKFLTKLNYTCTVEAIHVAAFKGYLDIVKWLHQNRTEGCTTDAMDCAAGGGHLDIVKWLDNNRTEGCTTDAMDCAAGGGYLDIVKWLHNNRTEGCTMRAMNYAASQDHLDIVKWLHKNRTEGCTTDAMDNAAMDGHLDVIKWLHENRTEGCTEQAIDWAAKYGRLDVIRWLYHNRIEGCTQRAIINAILENNYCVADWLYDNVDICVDPTIIEFILKKYDKCNFTYMMNDWLDRHRYRILANTLEVSGQLICRFILPPPAWLASIIYDVGCYTGIQYMIDKYHAFNKTIYMHKFRWFTHRYYNHMVLPICTCTMYLAGKSYVSLVFGSLALFTLYRL